MSKYEQLLKEQELAMFNAQLEIKQKEFKLRERELDLKEKELNILDENNKRRAKVDLKIAELYTQKSK